MGTHKTLALLLQLVAVLMAAGLEIVAAIGGNSTYTNYTDSSWESLPGCVDHCGDVPVPYPFGVGDGCYLQPRLNITCNESTVPPKAYLGTGKVPVTNISTHGELTIMHYVARQCFDETGVQISRSRPWVDLRSRFTISATRNKLVAVGCDTLAIIRGRNLLGENYTTGCMAFCDSRSSICNGSCSGVGCCEVSIPSGMTYRSVELKSENNHSSVMDFNNCSYGFTVEASQFNFSAASLDAMANVTEVPMILEWTVGKGSCREAQQSSDFACKKNSVCVDSVAGPGYLCQCLQGYQGNPYHPNGCQDIDECKISNSSCINGFCSNTPGSYNCICPQGYTLLPFINGTKDCQKDVIVGDNKRGRAIVYAVLSSVLGLLTLLVGSWRLHKFIKRREKIRRKNNNFKQNGGLLLQQQLNSGELNPEKTKLFISKELEKATNNFSSDRILGQGGQGTVYKGMLGDGRIVAVKKSLLRDDGNDQRAFPNAKKPKILNDDDQREITQFINEIVILSQINHRNVVRLLGCCLETQVPLLVYEFIPNGTLSQYIHGEDSELVLTWDVRFQIAKEVSGALSYLHSAASSPIYHRDIKSTNILLDEKYRAKIADFGTSRSVAIDQTHFTTKHVYGTYGYLDPEYFQSRMFTEKSDVYSFGVVLVELLTGKQAIFTTTTPTKQTKSLVQYFINSMENTNGVFGILDPKMKEPREDQIVEVAKLAIRCLNLSGKKRPTMREVAAELERFQIAGKSADENPITIGGQSERVNVQEIEPWDVSFTTLGSSLDTGSSSIQELSLLSFKAR